MIGKMSERITFQEYSLAADGAGGQVKTWGDLASVPSVWSDVAPGGGGEGFIEGRTNARGSYTFTIRERSDLSEEMRIVWRSENYDIRQISRPGSRPQYMTIDAERGV